MSEESKSNETGFDKQFAADVNGIKTEFVFHRFANKWLLLITQLGKIPGVYRIRFDIKINERVVGPIDNPEFHVSVPLTMNCCLGLDSDETRSGIQFLVNRTALNKCPNDEFVIGLGINQIDGVNLRAIAKILDEVIL
ncbi:uncharacterized protein Dwil_GK24410 [Drosophila willistoni]|uniref:Uncharacterized protein n=1 Tax=Drosophila willistoni TaxID=7260 RepID=B4N0U5_DROWI|nr:uncharacterized protein LOC6644048 [Drosophila willistoni]EDW77708.1 uncharacterized protein Dwil_GK24410 [Drosophila willistoni]